MFAFTLCLMVLGQSFKIYLFRLVIEDKDCRMALEQSLSKKQDLAQ